MKYEAINESFKNSTRFEISTTVLESISRNFQTTEKTSDF